jgi:hypothetical protein
VLLRHFFNTDLLYQLVEECEAMLDQLLPYWTNHPYQLNMEHMTSTLRQASEP